MYFELAGTNVRVMGSMHMLPSDCPTIPDWSVRAFDWCEEVAFEAEPTALSPSHLKKSDGVDLTEHLSRATWASLKRIWPPPSVILPLEEVRPWAALIYGGAFALRCVDGIEPLFHRRAAEESKQIHYLENGDDMASAFDTAPLADVVRSIELLVRDYSEPQRTLKKMYRAWVAEDLPGLTKVALHSPSFRLPTIKHAVILKRNQAWVGKMNELINSPKRTLVAVGALHLYGPGNLFECLGHQTNLLSNGG